MRGQRSEVSIKPPSGGRHWLAKAALFAIGVSLAAIFNQWRLWDHSPDLDGHIPQFIALGLVAGALYLAAVWVVFHIPVRGVALLLVIGAGLAFRALLVTAPPALSDDVYRYQWEGRIERAGINPYTAYPALPNLIRFEDPHYPIRTGRTTPTVYPPASEMLFRLVRTIQGYKALFTALDIASIGLILLVLRTLRQPLAQSLVYAWNPAVIVSFALSGHHDSLAILALLVANLLIIAQKPLLSAASVAVGFLAKLFPIVLLPVLIKKMKQRQWAGASVFLAIVILAYLPFARAGQDLFHGFRDYAVGWEANDSLFRLFLLAGNSKAQAELVAVILMVTLLAYVLKRRMEPLRASLILVAGLLLLSPNAFPWYFTWFVPFLCFSPNRPLLLLTVTSFLAYAPVIPYPAGLPYTHSPLLSGLEYLPVYTWLAYDGLVLTKSGLAQSFPGALPPAIL